MKNVMNTLVGKLAVAGALVSGATLGFVGVAGAQAATPVDPAAEVTSVGGDLVSAIAPAMVAAATAVAILLAVGIGLRYLWKLSRSSAR